MRKRRPVIILLCIQLVFTLLLASTETSKNLIIRNFGTEYIFEVENLTYYGNFRDNMALHCEIKSEIPGIYDYAPVKGRYGIIETDENGLSCLSVTTDKKPDGNTYIKSKGDAIFYFEAPHMDIHYEIFRLGETTDPPLFIRHNLTTSTEYEITASAYVFRGQIRLKEIYVDGVELIDFLTRHKEAQQ